MNSAHVDHARLEIYLDSHEVAMIASEPIQGRGRIGLVTKGDMVAQFDRLGVIEMVTNRTMSKTRSLLSEEPCTKMKKRWLVISHILSHLPREWQRS